MACWLQLAGRVVGAVVCMVQLLGSVVSAGGGGIAVVAGEANIEGHLCGYNCLEERYSSCGLSCFCGLAKATGVLS